MATPNVALLDHQAILQNVNIHVIKSCMHINFSYNIVIARAKHYAAFSKKPIVKSIAKLIVKYFVPQKPRRPVGPPGQPGVVGPSGPAGMN